MSFRSVSSPQRGGRQTPHSPLNLNNGKRLAMTKRPQLRSRVKGNLSSTVLKTSGGGDKPAEFNPQVNKKGELAVRSRVKVVHGFQTGDIVKAVVPKGKNAGTHVGRVTVRATGQFDISTATQKLQIINWKYCKPIHQQDGYSYV